MGDLLGLIHRPDIDPEQGLDAYAPRFVVIGTALLYALLEL